MVFAQKFVRIFGQWDIPQLLSLGFIGTKEFSLVLVVPMHGCTVLLLVLADRIVQITLT